MVAAQDVRTLHSFFTGSVREFFPYFRSHGANRTANLEHPTVRGWANTLMTERRELWASRGLGKEEEEGMEGLTVGSNVDKATANSH